MHRVWCERKLYVRSICCSTGRRRSYPGDNWASRVKQQVVLHLWENETRTWINQFLLWCLACADISYTDAHTDLPGVRSKRHKDWIRSKCSLRRGICNSRPALPSKSTHVVCVFLYYPSLFSLGERTLLCRRLSSGINYGAFMLRPVTANRRKNWSA